MNKMGHTRKNILLDKFYEDRIMKTQDSEQPKQNKEDYVCNKTFPIKRKAHISRNYLLSNYYP